MFMLKQNMAALMNRIATGAIAHADLRNEISAAIDQLRPYEATEPWVSVMMTNFERQIRLIGLQGAAFASRGISGIAANNAAVLATNRGITMMSQDVDDMNAHTSADMFSTPAQRHVSGGLVRGVSGGYALHPPPLIRSGLSGDIASMNPFSYGSYLPVSRQVAGGSIPQMPAHSPSMSRQMPVDYTHNRPSPIEIPPPPTLEELENPGSAPSTPRNQIRTVDPTNPPPAPRHRTRNPDDGEPSPKRARVTFEKDK